MKKITKTQINVEIKRYAPYGILKRTKNEIVELIQACLQRKEKNTAIILLWTLGFNYDSANDIVNNLIVED